MFFSADEKLSFVPCLMPFLENTRVCGGIHILLFAWTGGTRGQYSGGQCITFWRNVMHLSPL